MSTQPAIPKSKPLPFSLKIPSANIKSESPLNLHRSNISFPAPNKRIRGIQCSKSIIYGNISHKLQGSPDYSALTQPQSNTGTNSSFDSAHLMRRHTTSFDSQEWHRWTVYVRGIENEDLSYFIDKVVFILHDTYVNPIRVIENAPFEVTECGWGQFEVKIEIYFHSIPGINCNTRSQSPMIDHISFTQSLNNLNRKRKLCADETMGGNALGNKRRKMSELCALKQSEILSMFGGKDGLPNECDNDSDSSHSSVNGYESKIVFLHSLRLFPKPNSAEDHSKKGIMEEKYATIVFNEPFYCLYQRLCLGPQKVIRFRHPFYEKYWKGTMLGIASKEQELIGRVSEEHRLLLRKIRESHKQYTELVKRK